jgi:hypothetical protein
MELHDLIKRAAVSVLVLVAAMLAGSASTTMAARGGTSSRQPTGVQLVRVPTHGFDWGDAGIGAAAGIGLTMLAVGAALLLGAKRQQRAPRARPTARESR